jgi:hypothetical protein
MKPRAVNLDNHAVHRDFDVEVGHGRHGFAVAMLDSGMRGMG